jgi:lysozyme family protein
VGVRTIAEEQAHNIVKKRIYYGRNIDLLPPELQPQVLDASLTAEYGGIKTLQRMLNDMGVRGQDNKPLKLDGGIDENTIYAADSLDKARMRELRDRYAEKLALGYQVLAHRYPNLSTFLPGWLERTEFFRTFRLPRTGDDLNR